MERIVIFGIITVITFAVLGFESIRVKRNQLPADHSYTFENAKMSYSVIGNGRPVILVHGSMISNPWKGFENELSKSYKVYLPHLPGFGASDGVSGRLHNTELFAEALCTFIGETKLKNAPVVALSLGTVVTVKLAANGCTRGKLILVGMPSKVESEMLKKASLIPVLARRLLGSTIWGRDKILIPVLRDIVGITDKKRDEELLNELAETDTRSLVDLDTYKEIQLQMPVLLPKLTNQIVYIYGSKDKLIKSTKDLVKNPVIVEGADHNVFRSQPEKLLSLLKELIYEPSTLKVE